MNSEQALVWNMRTCGSDDKGDAQVETQRGQSTDAERRGGLLRSRESKQTEEEGELLPD
ncbi:hypothetical protein [Nitrincola alkalisediminis]|uniref:hypothetical protein n=1 Tax=Nitrincola alkalisediminis TaxID=1366656 RepID=UPI001874DF3C|nr:hypothetical protein [Nitrincola alkalisediminis]